MSKCSIWGGAGCYWVCEQLSPEEPPLIFMYYSPQWRLVAMTKWLHVDAEGWLLINTNTNSPGGQWNSGARQEPTGLPFSTLFEELYKSQEPISFFFFLRVKAAYKTCLYIMDLNSVQDCDADGILTMWLTRLPHCWKFFFFNSLIL